MNDIVLLLRLLLKYCNGITSEFDNIDVGFIGMKPLE